MNLPKEERKRLADLLRDSLKGKNAKARFNELLVVAKELLGSGIEGKCRDTSCVIGRMLIAYKMREEGYSSTQVGMAMARDHSSVLHLEKKMRDAFIYPEIFKIEMAYWGMFTEKLKAYGVY